MRGAETAAEAGGFPQARLGGGPEKVRFHDGASRPRASRTFVRCAVHRRETASEFSAMQRASVLSRNQRGPNSTAIARCASNVRTGGLLISAGASSASTGSPS